MRSSRPTLELSQIRTTTTFSRTTDSSSKTCHECFSVKTPRARRSLPKFEALALRRSVRRYSRHRHNARHVLINLLEQVVPPTTRHRVLVFRRSNHKDLIVGGADTVVSLAMCSSILAGMNAVHVAPMELQGIVTVENRQRVKR